MMPCCVAGPAEPRTPVITTAFELILSAHCVSVRACTPWCVCVCVCVCVRSPVAPSPFPALHPPPLSPQPLALLFPLALSFRSGSTPSHTLDLRLLLPSLPPPPASTFPSERSHFPSRHSHSHTVPVPLSMPPPLFPWILHRTRPSSRGVVGNAVCTPRHHKQGKTPIDRPVINFKNCLSHDDKR